MPLFRSEEHVDRWLAATPGVRGATLPVGQLCALAQRWWGDRLDTDWRPHSREHNQAVLDAVGLIGEFWRLA
jgi:hypothetical protein